MIIENSVDAPARISYVTPMNHSTIARIITAFAFAMLVVLTGCHTESADSDVRIDPDSAVLRKHESVTLTAHGGFRYKWALGTEEWGLLNTRSGSQVVYTSLYEPTGETPAVQVVTVSSTFYDSESDATSGTNGGSTSYVSTAEAYITHLAIESQPDEPEESVISE